MKKVIALTGLFMLSSLSFQAYAQKVKIKNDIATVDGKDYVKCIVKRLGSELSIYELGSEEETIYMMFREYRDPTRVTSGNPKGIVRWVEVKFLSLSLTCEVESRLPKKLIQLLYENEIFTAGKLNEENAKKFVQKYGTAFSDNKPEAIIIYNR